MRAIYFYLMKDDREQVPVVAPRHAVYWQTAGLERYEGGPFADRSGGLITFECASDEEAATLIAADPFVTEGLVESSWVKNWRPE